MYLPIFLPWAKQPTPHTPPPHLLPASSPRRCEVRPGVKCKRENAVVQTVPTTSVSHSHALGFSSRLFTLFLCHCISFSPSHSSLLFLSLSQVGSLLQVVRVRDPSANEKWVPSHAMTLMNLTVRQPITLLHLASPRKTALRHTHTNTQ